MRINNGAQSTGDVQVTLSLNATADANEMQVRDTPVFSDTNEGDGGGWEPYKTTRAWTLIDLWIYGMTRSRIPFDFGPVAVYAGRDLSEPWPLLNNTRTCHCF